MLLTNNDLHQSKILLFSVISTFKKSFEHLLMCVSHFNKDWEYSLGNRSPALEFYNAVH